ncbi:MAG: type II toxin-antitoxin system YafQ family toxin [Bacillota bacterium]
MLIIKYETTFKKDFKRIVKRGCDVKILEEVITTLQKQEPLPPKYKDHMLKGDYSGCRECHLTPDWLLIYKADNNELILYLTRTGSHSDLFS